MLSLNGTHGTCRSCAIAIQTTGDWVPTSDGRAGSGVYFWAFNKYVESARSLAVAWWNQATVWGRYAAFADKGCAVIYVQINVEPELFLDFDDPDVKDALLEAVDLATKPDEKLGDEVICKIYEALIEKLEAAFCVKYEVLKVGVTAPKKSKQKIVFGNRDCYVVRGDHKRICLQRVEDVGDASEVIRAVIL